MILQHRRIRFSWIIASILLIGLLSVNEVYAVPSGKKVEIGLDALRVLMRAPLEQRKLPDQLTAQMIKSLEDGVTLAPQLSIINALAFAHDEKSLDILEKIATTGDTPQDRDTGLFYDTLEVRGAASYALIMRRNAHLGDQQLFSVLQDRINTLKIR